MNRIKVCAGIVLSASLLTSGYIRSQDRSPATQAQGDTKDHPQRTLAEIDDDLTALNDKSNEHEAASDVQFSESAAGDQLKTQQYASFVLRLYFSRLTRQYKVTEPIENARSKVELELSMLQIQQNQKIIALLQEIAKKEPAVK